MDFLYFKTLVPRDKDYPPRQHELAMRMAVRDGQLYKDLQNPFHMEKNDAGQYIALRERRPSVRYNLCRVVVDDSVSLLFGDGHFPAIECKDEGVRDAIAEVIEDTKLPAIMVDAATRGSVGSVAIAMRVLRGRVFWSVMETLYLTPTWSKEAPDTLEKVVEQYKVRGEVLKQAGYAIDDQDLSVNFWFRREFDAKAETWMLPIKVTSDDASKGVWKADPSNTTQHNLGFVPIVWVKNLPGGSGVDGASTFPDEAVDTMIELDYQLSQGGRGLKYASDPTLLIKEPAVDNDGALVKGGGNAIVVGPDGDAKMLEISGTASAAVLEYVRACRELALENAHGNRSNADKLSAAQSGRAMELMNQSLIWLADKLRTSYGAALVELLSMVIKARSTIELTSKDGEKVPEMQAKAKLTLRWPHWYAPTYSDKQVEADTLGTLTGGRQLLSQATAVKSLSSSYDLADPTDELRLITADGPPPGQVKPGESAGNSLKQSEQD